MLMKKYVKYVHLDLFYGLKYAGSFEEKKTIFAVRGVEGIRTLQTGP